MLICLVQIRMKKMKQLQKLEKNDLPPITQKSLKVNFVLMKNRVKSFYNNSKRFFLLFVEPALIAKSNVILDVKPWDDETDMKELENQVRKISSDGLLWGAAKLVPLAYGIHKLQISCVVEDEKISIDWLQDEITAIEDYVSITTFFRIVVTSQFVTLEINSFDDIIAIFMNTCDRNYQLAALVVFCFILFLFVSGPKRGYRRLQQNLNGD
jgi:translation elongation factor EF-1beta